MEYELIENYEKDQVKLGGWVFTTIKVKDTWYLYAKELRDTFQKGSLSSIISKLPNSVKRAIKEKDANGNTFRYVLVSLLGVALISAKIRDRQFFNDVAQKFVVPSFVEDEEDEINV